MRPRKSVNVASLVASPEDQPSRPNLRLRVVGVLFLVLFLVLGLRLWTLQIIDGKSYAAAVTRNQVRVVQVTAPRGQIVDRNDTTLVTNVPQQEILLSRVSATQDPSIIGKVAALIGQTPAQVDQAVKNERYSPYEPVPVATNVSAATVQYLQTNQSDYPGVTVETISVRIPRGERPPPTCWATWATSRKLSSTPIPRPATPRAASWGSRASKPNTSSTCAA
jgi:cell division protein FtsI/penicillin-binding protein 2